MNCKEHHLPELELSTGQVREALQCILHTILLYVYSPYRDFECVFGSPLLYTPFLNDVQFAIARSSNT
jgi:hypothetical protein